MPPRTPAERRQEKERELAEGLNPLRAVTNGGPRVSADQGIFTVAWDAPEEIQLDFDLLVTERRTGDTSAEVAIYTTALDNTALLHRTRLNLLSTTAQERLAKYLEPRTKHLKLDWPYLLSVAAQAVLEWHRNGEPAILLREAETPTTGAGMNLIPPLLTSDGPTILFGDGGTGKSQLALALAASLHSGQVLIDGLEPEVQLRVGYLDWEWEPHVHRRRLERMWPTPDLPDLVYVTCRMPLRDEENRLRRIIRANKLEFLVLDSVALALGGEPESAEVALGFFNTLRTLGLPTLCVAHITKADAKASADKPFGSAFFSNSARSTWYVHRSEGSGRGQLVLGLFNRKANDAALARPFSLTMAFGEERTTIVRGDIRAEADLDANRTLRERIRDQLRAGPMLVHEIADALDSSIDAVRMSLKRGDGKIFVRNTRADGIESWSLLAHE